MVRELLFFTTGLLVGALITWFVAAAPEQGQEQGSAEEPAAKQPAAAAPVPSLLPSPSAPAPTVARDEDCSRSAKACEATLATIRAAHQKAISASERNEELVDFLADLVDKSGAGSPEGHPMTFPDGLTEAFRPEGFERNVEELKQSCPELFPPSTRVDCSEFPCLIQMDSPQPPSEWSPSSCPAYAERFGTSRSASGHTTDTPGGGRRHVMQLIPQPPDDEMRAYLREHEANLRKRSRARFAEMERAEAETR